MGCCIPKKPIISVTVTNKKTTQIKTAKQEKRNDCEIIDLSKSLATLELNKYIFSSPGNDIKINSSTNTELHIPFQSLFFEKNNTNSNNRKNTKQIKESLKKLKELSSIEVNNCSKFFGKKKLRMKTATNKK